MYINGQIISEWSGLPLPNAVFSEVTPDGLRVLGKSDSRGLFNFAGSPAGVYPVQITAGGYMPLLMDPGYLDGDTITVELVPTEPSKKNISVVPALIGAGALLFILK